MLNNFQKTVQGGHDPNYNPDVFEYDDELAFGEEG